MRRGAATTGVVVLGVLGLSQPAVAKPKQVRMCGTKALYGKTLTIRERGELIACPRVRKIVRGSCKDRGRWACFSPQLPYPLLVWFREKERFKPKVTLVIEALRYPCSEASVTAEAWSAARGSSGWRSPTRTQVLTDDLIRCGLLIGKTESEVVTLLGPADYRSTHQGRTFLDYEIGPERDSFFQIDNEFLSVEIGTDGLFAGAEIYQG